MGSRIKHAVYALLGGAFGLAASMTLDDASSLSIASAPSQAGSVFRLTFSKAHARGTKKTRRRARREAAERKAQEKRREETDRKLLGTRRATLPAGCVYDSNASATNSTETYLCGGMYYQRYRENGATGYEGHAVGVDRGEIQRAKARRAASKIKSRSARTPRATRKIALPANCVYDTYVSTATDSDVYACGGVRYRQFVDKGVTGYELVKP